MLKKQEKGQITLDFLFTIVFIGAIGFFIFLEIWTALDSDVVDSVNNLEGDMDTAILAIFYLIPFAVVANIIRTALKGKTPEEPRTQL